MYLVIRDCSDGDAGDPTAKGFPELLLILRIDDQSIRKSDGFTGTFVVEDVPVAGDPTLARPRDGHKKL